MVPEALTSALEAKERRRMRLARLPIEEKIRIVVEMQKMVAPILAQRGIIRRVWSLEPRSEGDADASGRGAVRAERRDGN